MHADDPVPLHVPALHPEQAPTEDTIEYLPATQDVQDTAPGAAAVFVMDPAEHTWQAVVDAES
jgi:hypothetical protein